jgi:peptide/nickel transport system substrate-binding protein
VVTVVAGVAPGHTPPDNNTLDWLQQASIQDTLELLRCCLGRTLLSYVGRPTNQGGADLRPDLATSFDVSSDGLTWTFHIRPGVHYAPPLQNVEVTARDFERGFQRAARVGPGVTFYNGVVGFGDYASGKSQSIVGLETPDPHTLSVHLTAADGDFAYRMSPPYVLPLPPSPADPGAPFGIATGHDDGDGGFIVSTGPYMLQGAERVNFSLPPAQQTAAAGLVAGHSITLVRNPSWRVAVDPLRPAYVDRIVATYGATDQQAAAAIGNGSQDIILSAAPPPQVPPDVVSAYQADPSRGRVVIDPRDSVRYITMNLATPPFDDLHVRRAVAYVIDRAGLKAGFGGAVNGTVTGHLGLDSMEDNALINYSPFATPDARTRLLKARQEMAQSRYDSTHTGMCDAAVCQHVAAIALSRGQTRAGMAETVRSDLALIGIHLDVTLPGDRPFFAAVLNPPTDPPMSMFWAWGKDYPNGADFFTQLYTGSSIQSGFNPSLLGATPEQLRTWGYTKVAGVLSVDDRINNCLALVGTPQTTCWTNVDVYLTEKVVGSIPFVAENYAEIVPPRVVNYSFDQFVNVPALDQIALAR